MKDKKFSSELERIEYELEQKFLEIENKKNNKTDDNLINIKESDKSLFELRKELDELRKKKSAKKTISDKIELDTKNKADLKKIGLHIKENKSNLANNKKSISTVEREKNYQIKKGETLKINDENSSNINEIIITKEERFPKNNSINVDKKDVSVKSKIIIYIVLFFALTFLGYIIKLRLDLNKEKADIIKKKQEQIDYSKNDAVFKEVEDETPPLELQKIDTDNNKSLKESENK